MHIDVLKEVGSIGAGNAATAISSTLNAKIRMTIPEVSILGYDEAIESLGGPEKIVAGVLVKMSGEIKGIMLHLTDIKFINKILKRFDLKILNDYSEIQELESSAVCEISNIIISSYINAIAGLSNVSIKLSVPGIAVNMLGGIATVPMVEYGYETDKLMMIGGKFLDDGEELYSKLLLMPDIKSLNILLKKLGVINE